ncbi:hypothetical protein SDC9_175163 [bioreactor metagenome]|uniref:Uncharacterized protein n=1 Tax=bioreactor metagenome TaxID=1076179 RepID=A0A645GPA6_9ZZZZ
MFRAFVQRYIIVLIIDGIIDDTRRHEFKFLAVQCVVNFENPLIGNDIRIFQLLPESHVFFNQKAVFISKIEI